MEHDATIDGIVVGPNGIILQLSLGPITPDDIADLYRVKGQEVVVRIRRADDGSLPEHG